ncbi:UDP-glucose 4-epimerase GalE [Burkholderia stabilis]|uniref:UDP-glucose 4-epimerase n=1 Tax=Burkholderia stabilis TaxID=95485 RepID=A0AAJ5NA20_9BURK|nr:UDP-glucose 4-epimerase GalE [Burkholderia stabilis]VBB14561.1 UDP-glucose 4-epimerase,UDP-galactose-4-epimerase,Putative NADH-flavin reductase,UDP-glucose 4-epimerase,NAD dependent epimerase/dehydratase family [Burkholderia stabilis]
MKVLVTGGAGYIGSHTCKALAQAGHEPVAYDNLSTGHRDAVQWGPLVAADILDRDALSKALAAHRPDVVIHFAALAYVGESVLAPERYYTVNVTGTCTLLSAMRAAGIGRIVMSSSCATYGVPDALPISERTPQQPINPYGFTKYAMERMAADFERAYGLKWVALRYFNAAGADPDGMIGECHEPETHALPLAIRAALGTGHAFQVMGTDYPTPDGSAIRDYVHVSDLADAHLKATAYLCRGGNSVALNLGTGKGTSVLDALRAVEAVTGRAVPTTMAARRPGDPPELYADATKAALVLGWRPRFTAIEQMVEHAAAWFQKELQFESGQ